MKDNKQLTVSEYAERWLTDRVNLAVRTIELYSWLLKRYVLPEFGSMALSAVTPLAVRSWNSRYAKESPTTAAKAYRLFALIMRTAVADELIDRTPCHVRVASERAPERPVATVSEVISLAEQMPDELRIAVYLAAWCQLRRGEVRGLRRGDIDLDKGTLTVNETRTTTMSGRTVVKSPKTRAGNRTIAIPSNVVDLLSEHLDKFVAQDLNSWWSMSRIGAWDSHGERHDSNWAGRTFDSTTSDIRVSPGLLRPVRVWRNSCAGRVMHRRVPQSVTSTRPTDAIVCLRMLWLECPCVSLKVLEILKLGDAH